MSDNEKESLIIRDRSSRRQFIRRGAAFVAVGGLVAGASPQVYADDCDRNASSEKNAEVQGSDSDAGASADPAGCGKQPKPKISRNDNSLDMEHQVKVSKVKA